MDLVNFAIEHPAVVIVLVRKVHNDFYAVLTTISNKKVVVGKPNGNANKKGKRTKRI